MDIFKKEYVVGLDIGTSSIKMVQLIDAGPKPSLLKAELKELARSGGNPATEPEILGAIKYLLRDVDIKKSRFIVSINCQYTAIKTITVPYIPLSELREGIKMELKSHFPFPVDDSTLDLEIAGDIVDKGSRKYRVIVAVSPRATVERYISILKKAGVRPASFVPAGYALKKASESSYSKDGRVVCSVDIGVSGSELVICKGKELLFHRKIPVAGRDFTKALRTALASEKGKIELDPDEAEKVKIEVGIPSVINAKPIDGKISTTQIFSMLRSPLEQLSAELSRCFDYYREETSGGKIDLLVLYGGGSSLGGLTKYLSEDLGLDVSLGDAPGGLEHVKGSSAKIADIAHRLELAAGAALSGAGCVNLLPPEIKEEGKRTLKRGAAEAVITAILIAALLLYAGLVIQLGNLDKRIKAASLELSSLRPQMEIYENKVLAARVLADEPQWEDVFKELSNLIPAEAHITELRMDSGVISVKGAVSTLDGAKLLSKLISEMEKGIFSDVTLVESKELPDNSGILFELKCRIDL